MAAAAIIGAAGISLIKDNEGLRNQAYLDPVGIPTICYGHTGPEVRLGMRLSDAECESLLLQDIAAHQPVLTPGNPRNCINDVPLNQNQMDALTSFVFNLGENQFCRSTMARRLRLKDYSGASPEFSKWVYGRVGGKAQKLPGLIKRRTEEKRLFDKPVPLTHENASHEALRAILRQSK